MVSAMRERTKKLEAEAARVQSGPFGERDYTSYESDEEDALHNKPDAASRPLWVSPDGHIFLEKKSPVYEQAYDFLVAIAEPVARPKFIHEYKITQHSLYAAVAVGIEADTIETVLDRLCKTNIPASVVRYIRACTARFGKAKFVLKQQRHYIESASDTILREMQRHKTVAGALADRLGEEGPELIEGIGVVDATDEYLDLGKDLGAAAASSSAAAAQGGGAAAEDAAERGAAARAAGRGGGGNPLEALVESLDAADGADDDPDVMAGTLLQRRRTVASAAAATGGRTAPKTYSFELQSSKMEEVKAALMDELDYPLTEEYAFREDVLNPTLPIDLKPTVSHRPHQTRSLSKMLGSGRARSGIIVLPCGAGKTLTGITAACTVKKSTIVLCSSATAVAQWKNQFTKWTNIDPRYITCFTADKKDAFAFDSVVLITTYTMMAYSGTRSAEGEKRMEEMAKKEWGLMLLDEVHVVPAATFRKVMSVKAHCKLGLTATLVREDDLIDDLNYLIGPKLYEADWSDLTRQGYLANVKCLEVWCPMTAEFYAEYLRTSHATGKSRTAAALYAMNPNKFRATEALVTKHVARGDKVIIFSDSVFALEQYCKLLAVPYIFGTTPEAERQRVLGQFRQNPIINCIGLSKVGDVAIDLPEANVIVQISSHFGSRRQEAQRLGRILRPPPDTKRNTDPDHFNAFFYTLVSTDTQEMAYSHKRQRYLVDQGYTFEVINHELRLPKGESKIESAGAERVLLRKVLVGNVEQKEAAEDKSVQKLDHANGSDSSVRYNRKNVSASSLAGGSDASYLEYQKKDKGGGGGGGGGGKPAKSKSKLFMGRRKDLKEGIRAGSGAKAAADTWGLNAPRRG